MAKEPPIDQAATTRIKNAIANGSYPIDLDKIADALFDAYKRWKTRTFNSFYNANDLDNLLKLLQKVLILTFKRTTISWKRNNWNFI